MSRRRSSGAGVVLFLLIGLATCVVVLLNLAGVVDVEEFLDSLAPEGVAVSLTRHMFAWRTVWSGDSGTGLDDVKKFTFFKQVDGGEWQTTGSAYYQFPVWWR